VFESIEEKFLKALPIVASLTVHRPSNVRKATINDWYVQPKLNCGCGRNMRPTMHCTMQRPTIGHVLRAMSISIVEDHASCIRLETEARAAASGSSGSASAFAVITEAARVERFAEAAGLRVLASQIEERNATGGARGR